MDSAQVDHELQALQAAARRLIRHRSDLTHAQKENLAAALRDLAPLYQDLEPEIIPAQSVRLLAENLRSKALLEAIFESIPSGLAVVAGPELAFAYVNPLYRWTCPHTQTDLAGMPYALAWADDPNARYIDQIRETLETGKPFLVPDFTRAFPDGTTRTFIFQVRRIRWDENYAVLLALWDITERQQMEEALIKSEQKINDLIRYAPAGIYEVDFRQGRFVSVNDMMCHLTGYTREALLEMSPADLLDEDGKILFQQRIQRWLAGERPDENVEYRVRAKDGHIIYALLNVTFKADDAGRPVGATVVGFDITEWKKSEQALMEAARQAEENRLIIQMQHRLLDQREKERLQIARDLHDGPLQDLMAALFELQGVRQTFPELAGAAENVHGALQSAINELRAFAQELRPPALAEFGLEQAIRAHLRVFREKHPAIHVRLEGQMEATVLDENVRLALYRIYQEAMNNLARHSGASEASIRLDQQNGMLYLEISDNGRGFNLPSDWLDLARQGHLGLVGMRERAEAAGGQVEILSHPGAGASVCVWAPLKEEKTNT